MSSSKQNWPVKGLYGRCSSVWGPPPFRFFFWWFSNFVGSESGQIQSVKLLQKMVSGLNNPQPLPATHCLYIGYGTVLPFDTGKGVGGGGVWTRENLRGAAAHKAGSKIPTWLTVSPAYKYKHLPQSHFPLHVNFFRWRHFALVST